MHAWPHPGAGLGKAEMKDSDELLGKATMLYLLSKSRGACYIQHELHTQWGGAASRAHLQMSAFWPYSIFNTSARRRSQCFLLSVLTRAQRHAQEKQTSVPRGLALHKTESKACCRRECAAVLQGLQRWTLRRTMHAPHNACATQCMRRTMHAPQGPQRQRPGARGLV
jgi:hypothetical protein